MENIEKTIKNDLLSAELEGLFKGKEVKEVVLPKVEQPIVITEEKQSGELKKLIEVISTLQSTMLKTDEKITRLEKNLKSYEQAIKEVSRNILAPKEVIRDKQGKIKSITIKKEN